MVAVFLKRAREGEISSGFACLVFCMTLYGSIIPQVHELGNHEKNGMLFQVRETFQLDYGLVTIMVSQISMNF